MNLRSPSFLLLAWARDFSLEPRRYPGRCCLSTINQLPRTHLADRPLWGAIYFLCVMELLADCRPGDGNEVQLADFMASVVAEEKFYALLIDVHEDYSTARSLVGL